MLRRLTTNADKIMIILGVIGVLMLISDQVWSSYMWTPSMIKITSMVSCFLVILVGFLRWKLGLIIFLCFSPWLLFQGISAIVSNLSALILHPPLFLKNYFYILYIMGITSNFLCILMAIFTFLGLIFWQKESKDFKKKIY